MKLFSIFRRKPDASAAGRALGELAHMDERRRIRARTIAMREEMGLPIPKWAEGWR